MGRSRLLQRALAIPAVSARLAGCCVAMGRGFSQSDATALIKEVQEFIARYGRRPDAPPRLGRGLTIWHGNIERPRRAN